jgi:hypothetical protein
MEEGRAASLHAGRPAAVLYCLFACLGVALSAPAARSPAGGGRSAGSSVRINVVRALRICL